MVKTRKRGFTLVELLITLALMTVVIAAAFSLNIFGVKAFNRGEDKSRNQFDVRMAADLITKEVRYAKSLQILDSIPSPTPGYYDIYISNGRIMYNKNGVTVSPPAVGEVRDFTLIFSKAGDNLLGFKVGKTSGNEYDMDTKAVVHNIGAAGPYKIVDSSGSAKIGIRYTLAALTDQQRVQLDKAWINIPDANNITTNIFLPLSGPNGSSISWTTSNSGVVAIDGKVTRSNLSDVTVKLTATISKGTYSETREFNLTVKKIDTSLTVRQFYSINDTAALYEAYEMPATVMAEMSDGSIRTYTVTWYPTISTSTPGIKTSTGSISGFTQTATLTVDVKGSVEPKATILATSTSNRLNLQFDKAIASVTMTSASPGGTPSYMISGNLVTIGFSSSVKNNSGFTVTVKSTDGGIAKLSFTYKKNGGWK